MNKYYIRFFDDMGDFITDMKINAQDFNGAEIYALGSLNGIKAADYVIVRIA